MVHLLRLKSAEVARGLKNVLVQLFNVLKHERSSMANPLYTPMSLALRMQLIPFAGMLLEEFRNDYSL